MEANVPVVSKNDNTRVIANQDGKVVQIPASQFEGGSGIVVVAFELNDESLTASISPADVKEAMKTSHVIATLSGDEGEVMPMGSFFMDDEFNPCIICSHDSEFVTVICVENDAWVMNGL